MVMKNILGNKLILISENKTTENQIKLLLRNAVCAQMLLYKMS